MSLTMQAYSTIKQMLMTGMIAPGQHFDTGRLASDLQMSRTPIREALLRLQSEGIIEIVAKKGIRLVPLSPLDLQEIYQIVSGLEVEAVGNLCNLEKSDDAIASLVQATDDMDECLKNEDKGGWNEADERFHRSIFDWCGNVRLYAEGHKYRDLAQRAHFVALRLLDPAEKTKSIRNHRELIKTIKKGDAMEARISHYQQRKRGGEMLVNIIKEFGLTVL